jgi:hypothetical protein
MKTPQRQTRKVKEFIAANATSLVVSGAAFQHGGGCYTLENGSTTTFTLAEMKSMPKPRWHDED